MPVRAGMLEPFRDEMTERYGGRSRRFVARFEIADDIFAENIALEIYSVARLAITKVGVLVGVGNYGNFRDTRAVIPARGGEADAVDGDRAFRNDVPREILGNFHAKPPAVAFSTFAVEMCHAACAVDVTLNKVATQFFAGGGWLLEVDAGSLFQATAFCAERRLLDCFAGKIGGEVFFVESDDREATTVHGDTV